MKKLLIASDIHGSAVWCRRLLTLLEHTKADRLVLLGDILYHGPRNALPEGYDPPAVISLLNAQRARILCVRGNCEAEVDQMVLSFPVLADYAVLDTALGTVYATHGHRFGPATPPPLCEGDILLSGHTHIPTDEVREGIRYLNPGSVSIPKEGSRHSCIVLEGEGLTFYDLETLTPYSL